MQTHVGHPRRGEGDAVIALAGDGTVIPSARRPGVLALRLGIVAHHGQFPRRSVGGRRQVAGPGVVLAHRPLGGRLRGRAACLLVTGAASRRVGLDPARDGLAPHTVRSLRPGEVRCDVRPLACPADRRTAHAGLAPGASAA